MRGSQPPTAPEVRWADDGAIEIRHDLFRRSTKVLVDCLKHGIEDSFGDGTDGLDRVQVWRETKRIEGECMGSLRRIPVPSLHSSPGTEV